MSAGCDDRFRFIDGEMDADEAARFRLHLAGCASCQRDLFEATMIGALAGDDAAAAPAKAPPALGVVPPPRPRRPRRRMLWIGAALATAAMAAAVIAMLRRPPVGGGDAALARVASATATRPLEARLGRAEADRFRRYDTTMSAPVQQKLPLRELAELEERGDAWGVGTALVLAGEYQRAAGFLERAPRTPEVDGDRAVIALAGGRLDEALALDDAVLAARPGYPQALWNRGLILRELGLPLAAADAFDQVARLGEPGWRDEAAARAAELRRDVERRRDGWLAVGKAGRAMVQTGAPISDEAAASHPGLARLYLYHAVRAAPSPERVRALAPLARLLDRAAAEPVLERWLERVAAADFRARAPLARDYLALFEDPSRADRAAIVARLRKGDQPDITLGALTLADALPAALPEYRQLVAASGDPWHRFTLEYEEAKDEIARGAALDAEQRLLAALPRCHASGLEYRCGYLERQLAELYLAMHRFSEARRLALSGGEHARRANEWGFEAIFLQDLASASDMRRNPSLTHAYLQETQLRQLDNCEVQRYVRLEQARLALDELRPDEARAALAQAPACGQPLPLSGIEDLAVLAHFAGTAAEAARARAALDEQRARGALRPGERAVADEIEGRLLVDGGGDAAAGRALLERAIAAADARPSWDPDAVEARSLAYAALMVDAARRGDHAGVLDLFAREAGAERPARCALGVASDFDRVVVAARGSDGNALGEYRAGQRPSPAVERLVPDAVKAALAGCPSVDVFARPPFQGRADLLPRDLAWRYRVGRAAPADARAPSPRRLIVSGVEAPPALGLPRLPPWSAPDRGEPGEALVVLSGADATPERVLAELQSATEIELRVHGLVDLAIADASFLVLAPGADGRYALTAGQVRKRRLAARPLVVLAACRGAEAAPGRLQQWSLPAAFVEAGARAVLASPELLSAAEAEPFFASVRAGLRAGKPPAVALRDARLAAPASSTVQSVLLFE